MSALQQIENYLSATSKSRTIDVEKWMHYLITTDTFLQNMEHVQSVNEQSSEDLLRYVQRTLTTLDSLQLEADCFGIIETVLKWSEVAKGGDKEQKTQWNNKGYNLTAHNEGSAQIYLENVKEILPINESVELIYELIRTHGLLGQYLRGESELSSNSRMTELLLRKYTRDQAFEFLFHLNACVISGVSKELWDSVKIDVSIAISDLLSGSTEEDFVDRIIKLRKLSNDSVATITEQIQPNIEVMKSFFTGKELWYVEPSLQHFSFNDFWTLFQLLEDRLEGSNVKHIHFGKLMKQMYYDYQGTKRVNIYRKRIVEKYLEQCRRNDQLTNLHVSLRVAFGANMEVAHVYFEFSKVGDALINFCVEAEKVDMMHSRASIMLYDFFGLRKDEFDRLHNEQTYLSDMNAAADDKRKILDFLTGKKIVDIGPGGGVLLDLIEEESDVEDIIGVDISENVIHELNAKKTRENRKWSAVKADALQLTEVFEKGSVDTIIYSSVLHELFSYIPLFGKKFNYDVIATALRSAFEVLKPGGRIIIRDGIMSEDTDAQRIIRFKDPNGMKWLEDYQSQFKGREICYRRQSDNQVQMPVNDALEFLYTYTWGDEAFSHEVNEQFAYFTPSGYRSFIQELFGSEADIVHFIHYLQEGYPLNLNEKIEFMDEAENTIALPDSTCLLIIEKR